MLTDESEPNCPHCLNHRWLIWWQYRDGRKDLEPVPLIKSCQHCNPDGELPVPFGFDVVADIGGN